MHIHYYFLKKSTALWLLMIIPRGSCKCLIEKALTRASLAFLWCAALSRRQAALGETQYSTHPPLSGVKHGYTECVGFPVCRSDCPVEPPDCFKEPRPVQTKFPRIWELDHNIDVFQSPRGVCNSTGITAGKCRGW